MTEVSTYIALGSNMGSPRQHLQHALEALANLSDSTLRACSSFYPSKALGPGSQADYLNAVCKLDTVLSPQTLLYELQAIESHQGRVRNEHWGPRTLDLDILLFGEQKLDLVDLQIPHPRMFERNFVLYPLWEIAPSMVFTEKLGLPNEVALESLLAKVGKDGLLDPE